MSNPSLRPPDQQQALHELFRNRDFTLLWFGQLLSTIGDHCLFIASVTLLSQYTDELRTLLIPAIAMAAPQIIFGLMGGVMADRWNRKMVMVGSDLLRGLIVLFVLLVTGAQQLWILYLVVAGLNLISVFFYPARNAVIPNIVPPSHLLAANGLIQGSYIVAMVVGPAVAGATVEYWMPAAIIFDCLTFFISAVIIAMMRIPNTTAEQPSTVEKDNVWEDMKAGLDFICRHQALSRVLIIMAIATLGIGAIILLAIPHLKEQLAAGGLEYGIAMSMLGLGSVMGGLVVSRLSRRLSTSTIVGGMLILAGIAIVAFAYASSYAVVLASVTLIGACIVVARGALDTICQAITPDGMRGRVQSAGNMLVIATTAIAQGLSTLLGDEIGVQAVFLMAGLITMVTGVVAIFVLRGAARIVGKVMVFGEV
jgi:MFS family permease